MNRVNSDVFRNNHHSLNRKQSPFSLHSSKNDSMSKPRKLSTASLKQNMPDLEKLIMDIKISPGPDTTSDSIKQIFNHLKQLEGNPLVNDQVHAVFLLMQSIENKINNSSRQKHRPPKLNIKKQSVPNSGQKQFSQVSPIKLINQDTSSRILYTNFSLKDIQKTVSQQNSLVQSSSSKKSTVKIAVSKFEESQSNDEVEKLNREIKYLEKLLENKTKGASGNLVDTSLFKKKSCRY